MLLAVLASTVSSNSAIANSLSKSKPTKQIRTLFYGLSQAFASSTSAGIRFIEDNNYPGAVFSKSSQWEESKDNLISVNFRMNVVPKIATIEKDFEWKVSPSFGESCWNPKFDNRNPKGRHYIVTVIETRYSDGAQTGKEIADVHVSELNGKFYFWWSICG